MRSQVWRTRRATACECPPISPRCCSKNVTRARSVSTKCGDADDAQEAGAPGVEEGRGGGGGIRGNGGTLVREGGGAYGVTGAALRLALAGGIDAEERWPSSRAKFGMR